MKPYGYFGLIFRVFQRVIQPVAKSIAQMKGISFNRKGRRTGVDRHFGLRAPAIAIPSLQRRPVPAVSGRPDLLSATGSLLFQACQVQHVFYLVGELIAFPPDNAGGSDCRPNPGWGHEVACQPDIGEWRAKFVGHVIEKVAVAVAQALCRSK